MNLINTGETTTNVAKLITVPMSCKDLGMRKGENPVNIEIVNVPLAPWNISDHSLQVRVDCCQETLGFVKRAKEPGCVTNENRRSSSGNNNLFFFRL